MQDFTADMSADVSALNHLTPNPNEASAYLRLLREFVMQHSDDMLRVRAALSKLAVPGTIAPAIESDTVMARDVLDRLESLLKADDTRANALFIEYEALLISAFGKSVGQMGVSIAVIDYPAALASLDALLSDIDDE